MPASSVRECDQCKAKALVRISRSTIFQFFASLIGFYPYICRNCKHRTFHLRLKQLVVSSVALALILVLSAAMTYMVSRSGPSLPRVLSIPVTEKKGAEPGTPPSPVPRSLITLPQFLTNEDVVDYLKTGMAPASLIWLIRSMPHRFALDSKSLDRLRQVGVPEEVIRAMAEVTPGAGSR